MFGKRDPDDTLLAHYREEVARLTTVNAELLTRIMALTNPQAARIVQPPPRAPHVESESEPIKHRPNASQSRRMAQGGPRMSWSRVAEEVGKADIERLKATARFGQDEPA